MTDLLALSAKFIDEGDPSIELGPTNRINLELSELGDGLAMVESFSHIVSFATDDGLVLFDATLEPLARKALARIREWDPSPIHSLVYTHGHSDHVGGGKVILADAIERGDREPTIIAHEAVPERFARYRLTNGYNARINSRQFGRSGVIEVNAEKPFFPDDFAAPSVTYTDHLSVIAGDTRFELHHTRGETDDHTWTWVPDRRAAVLGDLLIWSFPNAGNPQKVQRFPQDWARALRDIAALDPQLLLPAHGLPIGGRERVQRVLGDTAEALEYLVATTLEMMNNGETLDAILHTVKVPAHLMDRPWLQPVYDEPEFVVRNIWRFYGGWFDGNPARLKPAPDAQIAAEVASLAGGVAALIARARQLADADDLRLACQLAEWALGAAPADPEAVACASEIYKMRRSAERSLMAKGIFGEASRRS